jgi:hypothetical protein
MTTTASGTNLPHNLPQAPVPVNRGGVLCTDVCFRNLSSETRMYSAASHLQRVCIDAPSITSNSSSVRLLTPSYDFFSKSLGPLLRISVHMMEQR